MLDFQSRSDQFNLQTDHAGYLSCANRASGHRTPPAKAAVSHATGVKECNSNWI